MTTGYAHGTRVDVSRTRAEIDSLLAKHGATQVAIANDEENSRAAIHFTIKGARFRVILPMPTPDDVKKEGRPRTWYSMSEARRVGWYGELLDQRKRERWRSVLLLLKSKLEVVRLGLTSLEREFMADMVLPGGATVHQAIADAMAHGLSSGDLPRLLLLAAAEGDRP